MLTFKEIREQSGMNQTQFSKYFEIPYRTIQDWEHGKRKCPEYLLKLMQYKIENEEEKRKMKIYTADKETGTFIDECKTVEEAKAFIEQYEAQDKVDGTFEEGFYDIVDGNHCSINA